MFSSFLRILLVRSAQPSIDEFERGVALAVRASSVHGTQPWRFALTPDALELWVDRRPRLAVTDTCGRLPSVSCGEALYLAVLGLAGEGWHTTTEWLPDPTRPDLLARVRVDGRETARSFLPQGITAAERRRIGGPDATSDGPYVDGHPAEVVVSRRRPDPVLDARAHLELSADAERLRPVTSAATQLLDMPGVSGRGVVLVGEPVHVRTITAAPAHPDRVRAASGHAEHGRSRRSGCGKHRVRGNGAHS